MGLQGQCLAALVVATECLLVEPARSGMGLSRGGVSGFCIMAGSQKLSWNFAVVCSLRSLGFEEAPLCLRTLVWSIWLHSSKRGCGIGVDVWLRTARAAISGSCDPGLRGARSPVHCGWLRAAGRRSQPGVLVQIPVQVAQSRVCPCPFQWDLGSFILSFKQYLAASHTRSISSGKPGFEIVATCHAKVQSHAARNPMRTRSFFAHRSSLVEREVRCASHKGETDGRDAKF